MDKIPDAPTSELGSNSSCTGSGSESQWRVLFEMQNQQIQALIQVLDKPTEKHDVILPEFNPEKCEADAQSWCSTADLCFDGRNLEGSQLIMTISKALRGSATTRLSQITYPGMTWVEFKQLFTARFVCAETSTATLINLNNDKPKENESYAVYASRTVTSLLNKWNDLSVEQIAISTVIARLSQIDTRIQRLAFTTEVTTRQQLQQELQAFTYLKRKLTSDTGNDADKEKRQKLTPSPMKCHYCEKMGHKQMDCRKMISDAKNTSTKPSTPASGQRQHSNGGSSSGCCVTGHIASRCTSAETSPSAAPVERRVDLCMVEPPSGTLS